MRNELRALGHQVATTLVPLLVASFVVANAVLPALADTLVVRKITREPTSAGGQAQPGVEERQEIRFAEGRMAIDTEDQRLILRRDLDKLYIVTHEDRSYFELDLPFDLAEVLPAPLVEAMQRSMEMEIEVTPTERTQRVAGYSARLHEVVARTDATTLRIEVWASEEPEFDQEIFEELAGELFTNFQPLARRSYEAIAAIEGVSLLRESSMRVLGSEIVTREEIVSIEELEVPAEHYAPPEGYARRSLDTNAYLGMMGSGQGGVRSER